MNLDPSDGTGQTAEVDTSAAELDVVAKSRLFALLRDVFGVSFEDFREPPIERRIQRRMALRKLTHLEDYLRHVREDSEELRQLYSDLLVRVTSFFRDEAHFAALKTLVFPFILQGSEPHIPLRFWVAGCATGEEAFSLAISIREFLDARDSTRQVQIFATDLDDDSLARARRGVYALDIQGQVSEERLARYFVRTEEGYRVAPAVRDTVLFARHQLGRDPAFSLLDLITCRNLLIYTQHPLQKRIFRILHGALKPSSFLFLGSSESVGDSAELFSLVDCKAKIYAKKSPVAPIARRGLPAALGTVSRRHAGRRGVPGPDHATHELAARPVVSAPGRPLHALEQRVADLETALASTRETLQATILELRIANEELHCSNEELQSTNEELEASRMEMESTQDDILAVNAELQRNLAQLDVSNDDLRNILRVTSAPVVLVASNARLRSFSSAAAKLLSLGPRDVGKPVARLRQNLGVRDLSRMVEDVMTDVHPKDERVLCSDGEWYNLRITPYRTGADTAGGAVLELNRLAVAEPATGSPKPENWAGTTLAGRSQALSFLDERMCVVWANAAFLTLFRVTPEIVGRPLKDLWQGHHEQPELWKLLESTVSTGAPFERTVEAHSPDRAGGALRFSALRLSRDHDQAALTFLTIDVRPPAVPAIP